jgi:hypothetical protein
VSDYRVGLHRREGSVDGWVFDLPGCRAIGADEDDVRALLPVVIAEHLAWLQGHGQTAENATGITYKIIEDVESITEFCFEADKLPLSEEEIEKATQSVASAYGDLDRVSRLLPEQVLDWRPPVSAVKIDAIYPDVRSVREMLSHAAGALTFHLRGVGDAVARVPTPADGSDLEAAFEVTVARLRALNDEERAGTAYRRAGPRGEAEWSARKSIRRMVNHQRFHTKEIEQRLCWLTLGVPEVLPASRE